jgi:Lantibiotic dehydratase, N terminus
MTRREEVWKLADVPAPGWEFAPFALLRTALLPAELGAGLRFPRVTRILERYQELHEWLLHEREALSEALHGEVHRLREHAPSRRALINARRVLYQLKLPAPGLLQEMRALLAQELLTRVEAFLAALREQQALREDFPGVLEAEHVEKRGQLQALVRVHPNFHAALDVASTSLSEHLVQYLEVGASESSAPWRALESSLVSYLMRASMKASPLGRLAWVSAFAWPPQEEDSPFFHVELEPRSFRSRVELNRSVLRILSGALRAHPELSLHLKYRRNPDMVLEEEHANIFLRTWGEQLTERYGRIQVKGAHRKLLEYVERHGALSLTQLAGSLGTRIPLEQGLMPLRKLVELGLLVPRLILGDDEPKGLDRIIQELRETELALAHSCAERLEEAHTLVARYASGGGVTRVASRIQLQRVLGQVLADLSSGAPPALPERLLYENAVASVRKVQAPRILTRPQGSEAGLLVRLASVLADGVHTRLWDVEEFVRRHGVGGVCRNAAEFLLSPPGGAPPEPTEPRALRYVEELRTRRERLKEARRVFFSTLLEHVRAHERQEEVHLQPEWIHALLSAEPVQDVRACTLLLQASPHRDAFVLNAMFPGYGAMLTRFAPLLREDPQGAAAVERLQESLRLLARPGKPAQIVVASGHPVNVFPTLTAEALHSVGTPPAAQPLEREVRLWDLAIRHVPERHVLELVHSDGGVRVPLYLGLLATTFLPPVDQRLVRLAPLALFRPAFAAELEARAGAAPGGVRVWPRWRMGRFILARRTWVVHSSEELERRKGEGDIDYWVRLRRWADSHHLPRRFFFYPAPGMHLQIVRPSQGAGSPEAWLKPQLVDLDSAFSLHAWERLCRGMTPPWHFQEVLPTPEEAAVTVEGRLHVSELCLEVHMEPEP